MSKRCVRVAGILLSPSLRDELEVRSHGSAMVRSRLVCQALDFYFSRKKKEGGV